MYVAILGRSKRWDALLQFLGIKSNKIGQKLKLCSPILEAIGYEKQDNGASLCQCSKGSRGWDIILQFPGTIHDKAKGKALWSLYQKGKDIIRKGKTIMLI